MKDEVKTYGNWLVWHEPLPVDWRGGDWRWCRKDAREEFDTGIAESKQMALQSIDFIEQDEAERATPEGRIREEALAARSTDRLKQLLLIHQLGRALQSANSMIASGGRGFLDGTHRTIIDAALASFKEWSA